MYLLISSLPIVCVSRITNYNLTVLFVSPIVTVTVLCAGDHFLINRYKTTFELSLLSHHIKQLLSLKLPEVINI